MNRFFLDSSYVIALELAADQNHVAARENWKAVMAGRPAIVTTSYVFSEIVTFFSCRGKPVKAVEIGDRLLTSPTIRLVHVNQNLFESAWDLLSSSPDKSYSLADCASFVLMEREGLVDALTFDSHFTQAGFRQVPHPRR